MGGSQILKTQLGKKFQNVDYIYEWMDPKLPPFFSYGDFLVARSKAEFERIYS